MLHCACIGIRKWFMLKVANSNYIYLRKCRRVIEIISTE